MKECTLQEAIELCKKNGGRFTKKGSAVFPWVVVLPNGYVVDPESEKRIELNSEYFNQTWIYEPPKQSPFQKWQIKQPSYCRGEEPSSIKRYRKEGWNAAINEVLKVVTTYDGALRLLIENLKEG